MRNKFILLIALSFTVLSVFAQKNTVNLISSNDNETVLTFKTESYDFKTVKTPKGEETVLLSEGLSSILEKANPDLPKYTESLIIPDKNKMTVEIISSKYKDIENINIAPSKGNFTRDIDPTTIPYEYGKTYTKNAFYPNNLASLDKPYIVRDFRGQALHVYPFAYNPVTKTLRVYTEIKVKVYNTGKEGVNTFNRIKRFTKIDKEFKNIYSNHFINYANSKYTPLEEAGNMLVICYDDWTSEMQPFVDWKNTIGRPCEMVTVTEAGGTSDNIGTYVENYYNTNGLTYLLLVGDATQVPTKYSNGDSDNAYAYITGNDHYLEFFVGRFSAENAIHVTTQVQRTIEYEKGDQLVDGWLNKTIGIGSDQGPGDDNEYDYEHIRNMQTDLIGFTYITPTYELFDGSQGGNDASGSPSPSDVAADLNAGGGIITYCGHGADTYWVTSGFSVSDINNLTNDNKLPFIFDVACVNGNFVGQTCFGEAWLRAENNGNPTGAIAICASTINQSWAPPMNAQDEMVDLVVGTSANGTKRTFTGIAVNGMFQMNDDDGDFAMTDTWTTFGDPSLYIRTDNPSEMVISHDDVILVGVSNFDVSCDLDGAIATLSKDGEIIGSEVVSGGTVSIPVSTVTPGESLTLAVVGFNKVTYLTDLSVIAPSGPYLVVESYVNNVDFGQSVNLDMVLENVGQDPATGVSVTVTTSDARANITNGTYTYGDIAASSLSSPSSGAFTLTVDNDIEDQYTVAINITITDEGKTVWESNKNVTVNAPVLTIGNLTINDAAGNADGILDPGENADIVIQTTNDGHADVSNVIGLISSLSTDLTINSAVTSPYGLSVGETKLFTFNVTASASAPEGTLATIEYSVSGGTSSQYNANNDFDVIIGFVPEYCEASGGCDEYIENVIIGDIDNSSACDGYYDYTSFSTDVTMGETYPLTVTVGTPYSSDELAAYVDWNYDGDFDDAGEEFVMTWNNPTATTDIVVPEGISARPLRMRIRLTYNNTPEPCGTTTYGEVEDYTLNVIPNITQGGILSAVNSQVCEGSSTGYMTLSNNSGIISSWEKRLDAGSWTTIANTSDTYSEIPSQTGTWNYRVVVDGGAAYSNEVTILVNDATVGGSVTGGTTICEGEVTGTLTLSGHIGSIMKWQKALDGGSWEDISNNSGTYSETPNIDGTWSYRAVVQSGVCASENSGSTDVTVNPSAISGTVSADNSEVCSGSSVNLSLTSYEGNIQWQESFDGTNWTDISGATSDTYISDPLTDNTFFCAVISLGSCNDALTNEVEIGVVENPVAGYTFAADNQTLTFTNTSSEATSYLWDFGDSNSSTDENPVHVYDASGTYTVELTAVNGVCADGVYSENVTVTYVGISQIEANLKIMPNPNNGLFTVNFGNLNVAETSVSIFTVSGQNIYNSIVGSNIINIDLREFSKGIYFVKIISGNETYNSKVILK